MLSRHRGTERWFRLADRRQRRRGAASEAGMRWSARYRGACPCRHRQTVTPSLYSILSATSSQWSSSCNFVFSPRSYFPVLLITRAAAFMTQNWKKLKIMTQNWKNWHFWWIVHMFLCSHIVNIINVIIIVPALYLSSRSHIERLAYGSTPAVGSSRMTTLEPAVNAIAIDNFLCIPPYTHQTTHVITTLLISIW